MGRDTKWIVGTGIGIVVAILTTGVGLAGLMIALNAGVNTRFDDVNARIDDVSARIDDVNARFDDVNARFDDVNARIDDLGADLRDFRTEVNARMEGFDTRLRNVEIAFGKVDQRLLIIERFVLPTPEQPVE